MDTAAWRIVASDGAQGGDRVRGVGAIRMRAQPGGRLGRVGVIMATARREEAA